jgi:FKBP-type peptidyl-prolyl cis-trans isomerase
MKFKSVFYLTVLLLIVFSCKENTKEPPSENSKDLEEKMLKANQIMIETEKQEIADFIERNQWQMQETGSGLHYMIYKNGNGPKAETNDIAVFHFSLYLLTGDLLYTSEDSNPSEFKIGHGGVESGLEEGMKLLRVGDKARFILPSHLAFGLPGDGLKIPQRASIVYDIELIELK